MALGVAGPLLLRGPVMVGNWAPHGVAVPQADLYAQIAPLNQRNSLIGPAMAEGMRARGFSDQALANDDAQPRATAATPFLR
jgi:uncharacterized protein (DUF1501 family)